MSEVEGGGELHYVAVGIAQLEDADAVLLQKAERLIVEVGNPVVAEDLVRWERVDQVAIVLGAPSGPRRSRTPPTSCSTFPAGHPPTLSEILAGRRCVVCQTAERMNSSSTRQ